MKPHLQDINVLYSALADTFLQEDFVQAQSAIVERENNFQEFIDIGKLK